MLIGCEWEYLCVGWVDKIEDMVLCCGLINIVAIFVIHFPSIMLFYIFSAWALGVLGQRLLTF